MGGENLSSKKHLMARANLEEEEQERKSQKEKKEEGKKREWLWERKDDNLYRAVRVNNIQGVFLMVLPSFLG